MTKILASQSAEMRAKGEALIQQADRLLCESWNERTCSDGEPIDPSPTIDQAVNGGFPWLEIRCARARRRAIPTRGVYGDDRHRRSFQSGPAATETDRLGRQIALEVPAFHKGRLRLLSGAHLEIAPHERPRKSNEH
jgi:hypothetical protein